MISQKKVKSCAVCPNYQKTKVAIEGINYDACSLTGWLFRVELAQEQALCQE